MSTNGNRLTATLESYPRLTGVLFTALVLLSAGVSAVAASSGANVGP